MARELMSRALETGDQWFTFSEEDFSTHFGQVTELGTLTDAVTALWGRQITWVEPHSSMNCWVARSLVK
jgi:hypothetical protein